MSIGSIVTTGLYAPDGMPFLVTLGYGSSNVAPPAPPPTGGMVKRRRGRYEIELDGQRLIAGSIPALEAMVARWRKTKTANDNPRKIEARKPQPRKEVVHHPAAQGTEGTRRSEQHSQHSETPPPAFEVVGAVAPAELQVAQQALAAQAVLEDMAKAEAAARVEIEAKRLAEEQDDIDAIMAILEAVA